jgi:hypothetical protein
MNSDNTQDGAEPSLASAGSQPVAWAAVFDGEVDAEFVWPFMAYALAWAAARPGVEIVPLYRQQQPALTDEERDAVEWFARHSNHGMSMRRSATLRSLLERLSPPAT